MDEVIEECIKNKDKIVREILTSIGTRCCISYNSYFPFVIKVCENIDNIGVLSVYYCIIAFAEAHYLVRNNSKYTNFDTNVFSKCCSDFSLEAKVIANELIKEYFNDEYKEIFRKEFGFGGTTY